MTHSLHDGILTDPKSAVDGFELTLFCFANIGLHKIPPVTFVQNLDILSLKHITIPGFMLQASFNI